MGVLMNSQSHFRTVYWNKNVHALTCKSIFRNVFQGNNYNQVQGYVYESIYFSVMYGSEGL